MTAIKNVSGNLDSGSASEWGGDDIMIIDNYLDDIDVASEIINGTNAVRINTVTRFRSTKFILRDSGNDHNYIFVTSDLAGNVNITYPALTGNDIPLFVTQTQNVDNKTIGATCTIAAGALPSSVVLDSETDIITDAMLANMTGFSVKGRSATGTGDPADITLAADRVLGRSGSGNVGGIQIVTNHITDANVTDAKLANMTGFSIKGKATTGSGVPADITVAADRVIGRSGSGDVDDIQIVANHIASDAITTVKILDDNVTYAKIQNVAADDVFLGRISGAGGNIEELTGTQATTLLNIATSALKGLVPASGGGTTNFLRADFTWAAPQGGGGGEANTASNSGTAGVGVWARKTGVDLEFKNINTTTGSYLTITDDTGQDEIDIDLTALVAKTDVANIFTQIQTSKLDNSQPIRIRRDNNTVGTGVEIPLGLEDSAGADVDYARIRTEIKVNTAAAETGIWELQSRIGGSMVTCLRTNDIGVTQLERGVALGDVISPAQLTANTNDWNPTDLQRASIIRVNTDANFRQLTGITAPNPESNKVLIIRNISANTLLLKQQSTSSTAANRFDFHGYDIPLFPKDEIRLIYDVTLDRWVCPNYLSKVIPTARLGFYYRHDMFGTVADSVLSSMVQGTGASNSVSAVTSLAAHSGVVQGSTGTTATGSATLGTTNWATILMGQNWYWRFESMLRINTNLSSGTQRFGIQSGFADNLNAGAIVDGLYADYIDNANSGNWRLRAFSNSSATDGNSSSAVAADTWYRLTVIQYPDATGELFVNGTSVATVASGLPTGASRGTGFATQIYKTIGTTARLYDVDYIEVIGYANTVS